MMHAGSVVSQEDPSASLCAGLIGPVIARYPSSLDELSECLMPRAGQVVPLPTRIHQTLCRDYGPVGLMQHIAMAEVTALVAFVGGLCFFTPQVEGNEGMTLQSVGDYFKFLSIIDGLQTPCLHLTPNDNINEQGSTVSLVRGQGRLASSVT